MTNSLGKNFIVSIFGESHSEQVGIEIEGCPAGIALNEAMFESDLSRRRSGALGTTPRIESDIPHIIDGVVNGVTSGNKITITFKNNNTRSGDYSFQQHHPRPSHADFTSRIKYGQPSPGGGIFSGRMTVGLVAAGVVAKQILPECQYNTHIVSIGGKSDSEEIELLLKSAAEQNDSVGGVVECRIDGIPIGVGEPFFDSVESVISHALFSIPGVKGVEFGAGFSIADMRGSEANDCLIDEQGHTATNHSGGINGGISNGNQLVVRVAFRPTASIGQEQMTYNFESGAVLPLAIKGRHDVCIALRGAVVVEAMCAIALADLMLQSNN